MENLAIMSASKNDEMSKFVSYYREKLANKLPTVLSVVQNKGGVGKTRLTLLLGNALARIGFKVVEIDLDYNNSTTAYHLNPEDAKLARTRKNIAKAISSVDDEDFDLLEYAFDSARIDGIKIIPSSRKLANYRGMSDMFCLKRMVQTLSSKEIDFVIFDTEPSYTNMVINAENAADMILSPAFLEADSGDAALFISEMLKLETSKYDNWYVLLNGYNHRYENAQTGEQKDYIDAFIHGLGIPEEKFTPKDTWFPWTKDMKKIKDRFMNLSETKQKKCVQNPALYNAVLNLAQFFISKSVGENITLPRPEII